jgi:branched-chain amino acid transport system substrate-binding protein
MGGAEIVTGYVNANTLVKLEPLFASANALFICLDSGMHFPVSLMALPHIFSISLQGALCSRIAISHALADGVRKFAFTCSFYDSGYRSGFGFARSVEDGGAEVTFNHITALKRADFTLSPLESHISEAGTEAVFASFCGDMAQDFLDGVSKSAEFPKIKLIGSSFLADEVWLDKIPFPLMELSVAVPWAAGISNAANTRFKEALKKKKQQANIFSLLAYEAGSVIAAAIHSNDTDEAVRLIEGLTIESPRGTLSFDPVTHLSIAPVYEARIVKNEETGNCRLEVIGFSAYTAGERAKLERDIREFKGSFTSWFNAYGCLES